MNIKITQKEALRCWKQRDEGGDMCGYDFTDHTFLLGPKEPHDVSVYLSPDNKVIATKGGWAHDITNMI